MTAAGTDDLLRRVLVGDQRAIGRAISIIEDAANANLIADLMRGIFPLTGHARVVGVTGPPGAGKSTLVDQMVLEWRSRQQRVAVLAVDPSSPFTGGAVLGDRIRMNSVARDPAVFIRSMASRSQLGGLAVATRAALRILDAAGFDVIVVETIGVGQSEVAIAESADCVVLVSIPGAGDVIQTMKGGVLEIGDVYVVNKSDREGALQIKLELDAMLAMSRREPSPKVLLTRANNGEGTIELVDAIDSLLQEMQSNGTLPDRRLGRLKKEALELVGRFAQAHVLSTLNDDDIDELVGALRSRTADPAAVAQHAVARTFSSGRKRASNRQRKS